MGFLGDDGFVNKGGAGGGLAAVSHDGSLSGDGTGGLPLAVVNPLPSNDSADNGDLKVAVNASPVAPGAGSSKMFAASRGGRPMLSAYGPAGTPYTLQPGFGARAVGLWLPSGGGATNVQNLGVQSAVVQGTATARAPASTSYFTQARRVGLVSAAGAGSTAGMRCSAATFWRGNAAGLGGFYAVLRFAYSDASLVATGRGFAGLWSTVTAMTDVNPSTLTNIIGVGNDNGDANMQLYASGAVAQARVDLGANFPAGTVSTDVYELILYAAPNDTQVTYQLTRLNTGHTVSGTISAAANLPANTTFLSPQISRGNGGTASAVGIDLMSGYFETEV